mgnify:CR=1 FL=1
MKTNTIKHIERSDYVNMGPIRLRQPLPSQEIDMVDPFILLHHYGPYHISEEHNPFDLGPHPHRGFETVSPAEGYLSKLTNEISGHLHAADLQRGVPA